MKLLRGLRYFPKFDKGVVATIGNFDGVHLGHQRLILALQIEAKRLGLPLVVILFEPQPREYFKQDTAPARIFSLREKLDMLGQCQVDFVYCIKFDKVLAQTAAKTFIESYLVATLKVKYLLVGEDFKFGKNKEGDIHLLRDLGKQHLFEVSNYPDQCLEGDRISSTRIRSALWQADLSLAATLLGRSYALCGRVIRGDGRGRQWGIPTANLSISRTLLPLQGVFVVHVRFGLQIKQGVANIGRRPTVDGSKSILEVHLFDFNESIYGELLQVVFLHKLRDEVKFTAVEALITQIHHDIAAAKNFFINSEIDADVGFQPCQLVNDFSQ